MEKLSFSILYYVMYKSLQKPIDMQQDGIRGGVKNLTFSLAKFHGNKNRVIANNKIK